MHMQSRKYLVVSILVCYKHMARGRYAHLDLMLTNTIQISRPQIPYSGKFTRTQNFANHPDEHQNNFSRFLVFVSEG